MLMKALRITLFLSLILAYGVHGFAGGKGFSCEEKDAIQNWVGSGFKVIVCSYGSAPVKFEENWWRGNGLSFYKVHNNKRVLIRDHSEYYPELDYSYKDDTLTFIIYTYQPNEGKFNHVPFLKETVFLKDDKLQTNIALLIQKPQPIPAEVHRLFSILSLSKQAFQQKYPDVTQQSRLLESSLYGLRNYGLIEPDDVAAKLSRLEASWWNDGSVAETLRDIQQELQIIIKVSKHN